jgi:hypothetical protein
MHRHTFSLALALALPLFAATEALAQCPDPVDRITTFPVDGSNDVPVNAVLHAEFPGTQNPGGRPTWIVLDSFSREVEGTEGWDDLTATFTPASDLEPRSPYYARVSVAATGQFLNFEFNTGDDRDVAAPAYEGISGLSWAHRDDDWLYENCSMWPGESILYTLDLPGATDDASTDHLCYHVYQTSGPGISGPTLRARVADPGGELTVLQPVDQGEGEICFRVEVRDLLDRWDGNRREQCVEVILGGIFQNACSTSGAAPRSTGRAAIGLALLVLVAAASRRRGA